MKFLDHTYPVDCLRLQKLLLLAFSIEASLQECQDLWEDYSGSMCASWLFLGDDEDAIKKLSVALDSKFPEELKYSADEAWTFYRGNADIPL